MKNNIITIAIEDLITPDYNPRVIDEDSKEALKKSIQLFGDSNIITINKRNNHIIGGNQRISVMKELGYTEVNARVLDLSDSDEKALNIALNSNKLTGDWEPEKLDSLLNELKIEIPQVFIDLRLDEIEYPEIEVEIPFDEKEGSDEPDEDSETENLDFEIEPRVKAGQIWKLGYHRLFCGNCTDKEKVSQFMDGKQVELLFTSPPYSDLREYENQSDLDTKYLKKFIGAFSEFTNFQVINFGIVRKNYSVIPYWDQYINEGIRKGYKLLSWNVWDKGTSISLGQQTAFMPLEHEFLFVLGKEFKNLNPTIKNKTAGELNNHSSVRESKGETKKKKDYIIKDKKKLSTIIRLSSEHDSQSIAKKHPARFPVKLPLEYILSFTDEMEVIADPFLGSGTTLMAAEKTFRVCYGIEINPSYCDIILTRWERESGGIAELIEEIE